MNKFFAKFYIASLLAVTTLVASFGAFAATVQDDPYYYGDSYFTYDDYLYDSNYQSAATTPSYACTPHFFKGCIGNVSYWYDSCGRQENAYANCSASGSTCQKGACVSSHTTAAIRTAVATTSTRTAVAAAPALFKPANTHGLGFFVRHFRTACYNDNIFWYNSQGGIEDIQKSCQDDNACTLDTCRDNGCAHRLMCDGSACSRGSDDFKKYCGGRETSATLASNTTAQTAPVDNHPASVENISESNEGNYQSQYGNLAISMFGKKSSDTLQWQKVVRVSDGDQIDFLITVKNVSLAPTENVSLKLNLNNNVAYAYNLMVDSVASSDDITKGINLGTINPKDARVVTFAGLAKTGGDVAIEGIVQLNNEEVDHDSFQITIAAIPQNQAANLQPSSQEPANTQPATKQNAAVAALGKIGSAGKFFKSWYLWGVLIAAVLVGLFIVIFRRLSAEV